MATGLDNLWIYKLAEETKRNIIKNTSNNYEIMFHAKNRKEKNRKERRENNFANLANPLRTLREIVFRGALKSARKNFLPESEAKEIAEQYTVLLKGTNAYIRFLMLKDDSGK